MRFFPPHERGINGQIYRKRSMVRGSEIAFLIVRRVRGVGPILILFFVVNAALIFHLICADDKRIGWLLISAAQRNLWPALPGLLLPSADEKRTAETLTKFHCGKSPISVQFNCRPNWSPWDLFSCAKSAVCRNKRKFDGKWIFAPAIGRRCRLLALLSLPLTCFLAGPSKYQSLLHPTGKLPRGARPENQKRNDYERKNIVESSQPIDTYWLIDY